MKRDQFGKFLKWFFGLILIGLFQPVMAQEFFVSPGAPAAGTGSIDKPFSTISKALDAAQQVKQDGSNETVTITLREGTYRFSQSIVLDSTYSNMIIRAYPGEKVIFSGGKAIQTNLLQEVKKGDGPLKRYRINLSKGGITDYGKIRNVGFARPYGPSWGELFVNGRPLHLSRWPNKGMIPMGKVLDSGSIPRKGDYADRGGVIQYDSARVDQWAKEKDAWMAGYFMWGYADDMVKIKEINTQKRTITTASATLYGYGHDAFWRNWYGVNLFSELDEADEFYLDRSKGLLYFLSRETKIESLEFSVLEEPFIQFEGVKQVSLKGIEFCCSRGIGLSLYNTHRVTVKGCSFRNLGSVGITVGLGIEPFQDYRHEGTGVPRSAIVGSLQQHLYSNTVFNRQGGTDNRIINCQFYNLGAGGVVLGGGNRITLEAGNNQVENCVFHALNRIEKSYRPAVHLTGVGNSVRHCEIYDTPSMAIYIYGNDHVIEYNYLHDVCLEAEDQGAIYYGRNPSELGNVVRFNYFENIPDHFNTCAVYHDDGACGMLVYGNVFYKAGKWNMLIGGGSDNIYRNNIFIGNKFGIHVDNRNQTWGKGVLEKGGLFEKRLEAVNYLQPPYVSRYPQLSSYLEKADLPTGNIFENNVFVQVNSLLDGQRDWLVYKSSNLEISVDPGFKDWETHNFQLKKQSMVYKKLPAFEAIPFQQIGLIETDDLPTILLKNGIRGCVKDDF